MTQTRSNTNVLLVFLLILAAGAAIMALRAVPNIQVNGHAVERHGDVAVAARNCLDNNGPWEIYRNREGDRFHLLCRDDDGTFYDQIIQKDAQGVWQEVTAFMKGNGSWKDLLSYMHRIGATKWTRPLP